MSDLLETEQVGPYTLECELDKGAFGVVYRAHFEEGGEPVAIKIASTAFADLPTRELVWQQNEIETLERVNHPSVVHVLDHGFLPDGRLYLVMELVRGVPLNEFLSKSGPLEPLVALGIALKVAEALAHCHGQGILHLDLKPKNIMVVDPHEPSVKVLDFGLARLRGAWTPAGERTAGTPEYMPPEAFEATRPEPDTSVDLYGLGTVLYELLTGQLPFRDTDLFELYKAKCEFVLAPVKKQRPELPSGLDPLLRVLMAPERTQRASDANEVVRQLRNFHYALLGLSVDLATVSSESRIRHRVTSETSFIGRQPELEALDAVLQDATGAEGASAMILGDVGVGKSRLIRRFVERSSVGTDGRWVALGRCRQYGALVPFTAFREAMSHLALAMRTAPRSDRTAVLEGVAAAVGDDLQLLLGYVPEFAPLFQSVERDVLARVRVPAASLVARITHRILGAIGKIHPLTLCIEDIHLADTDTRTAIRELLEEPVPAGCLVLISSRDPNALTRIQRGKRDPKKLIAMPTIVVEPFNRRENDTLIAEHLGTADKDLIGKLKRAVPLLNEGVPLLTLQLLHNLEAEGCIERTDDTPMVHVDKLQGYAAPSSVVDVLHRNLARVSTSGREVLGVGALVGMRFNVSDLKALDVLAPEKIDAGVEEGLRHHVIVLQRGVISFVHEDLRTLIAKNVDEQLRPEIHRRFAALLQSRDARPGEYAWHLEEGGDAIHAAEAYIRAATLPEAHFDPEGAFEQLTRAVDLLLGSEEQDPSYDHLLARAAFEVVRTGANLGPLDPVRDVLKRVAPRLEADPLTELALDSARAWLGYASGDFATAIRLSEKVLSGNTEGLHDRFDLAPANIVGRALCASGRFTRAVPILTHGCVLARDAEEFGELCHSQGMLGLALGFHGQIERAEKALLEAQAVANALNDPIRVLASMAYGAFAAEFTYDWDRGVRATVEVLRYAEEHRVGGLYPYLGTMLAGRHQFHVGRMDRAQVLLRNALHLASNLDIAMGIGWTHAFLGDVWLVSGKLDDAKKHYEIGFDIASQPPGDEMGATLVLAGLGHHAALAERDSDRAVRCFEEALARSEKAGIIALGPHILMRYADALESLGDAAGAELMLARSKRAFKMLGVRPVDWWPRVPDTLREIEVPQLAPRRSAGTTSREFWLHRFAEPIGISEDIDLSDLRSTLREVAFSDPGTQPAEFLIAEVAANRNLDLFDDPTHRDVRLPEMTGDDAAVETQLAEVDDREPSLNSDVADSD